MEDDDDDPPVVRGNWFDSLGVGGIAVCGTVAAIFSIVLMALVNQIGAARLSDAAVPVADDALFEAPVAAITTVRPADFDAAWVTNAEPFQGQPGQPIIAVIVLDDGVNSLAVDRALDWVVPLSFAVAPDLDNSQHRLKSIRRAGREALALLPMGYGPDFGRDPNVLRRDLSEVELQRRLRWHLARSQGVVGAIDHNGGDIMRDIVALRIVGQGLAAEGLLYVDAGSARDSIAAARLRALGVPSAYRTTRIERKGRADAAFMALTDAEKHAFTWGAAIVVVESDTGSMAVLAKWLRNRNPGIAIAPVSHVMRRLRTGPAVTGQAE